MTGTKEDNTLWVKFAKSKDRMKIKDVHTVCVPDTDEGLLFQAMMLFQGYNNPVVTITRTDGYMHRWTDMGRVRLVFPDWLEVSDTTTGDGTQFHLD